MLLILIILCSTYGKKQLAPKIGHTKMSYMIELLEYAVCFEEFSKDTSGFDKDLLPGIQDFLKEIRTLLLYVVPRSAGDGLNLLKLHLLDHVPGDCDAMGSPANISGGPGESNQKVNKAAGRRTESFDMQPSTKLVEKYAIQTAAAFASLETSPVGEDISVDDSLEASEYPHSTSSKASSAYRFGSAHYQLDFDEHGKARLLYCGPLGTTKG